MRLPDMIPSGARVVVRCEDGVDEHTGRMTYRDFVGHVINWNGERLLLRRDAPANGSRPEQIVHIEARDIAVLKPVPERTFRTQDNN
ncbi:DUF6725 family protein [Bifidobacterium canis]|nr:DUF6725 family protein [Bifidobacterium canis]